MLQYVSSGIRRSHFGEARDFWKGLLHAAEVSKLHVWKQIIIVMYNASVHSVSMHAHL